MKNITSFALLILVSSMVLGGITDIAHAQNDPSILLKIAKHAQKQLEGQITQDSSDKTKQLFKDGIQQVNALEESLKNNNIDLAKKHFLSAMRIFKEISQQLTNNQSTQAEIATLKTAVEDPSADLLRMQDYVDNLKIIAKKYSASIDFSELDTLFVTARQQILDNQFDNALQTISKIKQITININNEIRVHASQQEQSLAKEYAQKYLEQLDRLIENAKNQGLSKDIIQKLDTARENLSSATDPHEIIKQIREIISIKEQFELTKNDRLESRVMQVEKILLKLSNSDKLSQTDLEDAKRTLQTIKDHLAQGEFETANELLRSLATLLEQFRD
ncbi:MAG TPA: hypothetical protein VFN17_05065 [Nitrosarchaeum sp.]|nr:hypothetical protein [Nitrosarchaeum sp.]